MSPEAYRYQTPIGNISRMCLTITSDECYLECRGQTVSSGAWPELYEWMNRVHPEWNGRLPTTESFPKVADFGGRWLIKAKLHS